MKELLKKLVPEQSILVYHNLLARAATAYNGSPSQEMIVIGVTGTKGKTSTINFIWACLTAGGFKTGIISTANIRIGQKELLNKYHMTMPDTRAIQGLMAKMVKAGCRYCLVETTSEGIKHHRHVGINYDIAVFTNLTPEHLQSHHGSFEEYKKMKVKIFRSLVNNPKTINGQKIDKVIIANNDSEHANFYLDSPADEKLTFSLDKKSDYQAEDVKETSDGVTFKLGDNKFRLGILGRFNVYNALPAIIIARLAGVSDEKIATGLTELTVIPGRMELINEGQDHTVVVDYAHEKESITNVLTTANNMKPAGAKTIILLGAEGGGRDKAKRPIMGELSAKLADYVVVTNVDPYEDDPQEILEDIAVAAEKFGKVRNQDLFVIEDRAEGIRQALALAGKGDVVLITGKGAEQSIVIGGKKSPWDDRAVVKTELNKLLGK